MSAKDIFVMLNHPNGTHVIMTEDNDEPAWFCTMGQAVMAAEGSWLGDRVGYEIFQLGCGEKSG